MTHSDRLDPVRWLPPRRTTLMRYSLAAALATLAAVAWAIPPPG